MITAVSIAASVAVLVSYLALQRGASLKQFDIANALCAPPILLSEVVVGAWAALILTTAFGTAGAVGWYRAYRRARIEVDPVLWRALNSDRF